MTTTQSLLSAQTQASSLHPVILRLFEKQGLSSEEIVESLSWDLKKLPQLTNMHDVPKAAHRIIEAMEKGEKIGIYGDYDVDGTTSCALFYHFFQMYGHTVELFQPSRFSEGYGLHLSSIDKAIDLGIHLLVTVDCGITNNEAAEYALERGLDLIITDHHKETREERPLAYAVVNPNRRDEPPDSPLKTLAGVGVAFAICLEIKNQLAKKGQTSSTLYPLLQFVAIGTICDLAKLTPMNKKLVRHGLKQIKDTQYPGIKSFFPPEERKVGFVPAEKLSFGVGPLINSKGRLDHPEKALQLLITDDSSKAFEYYQHLKICNQERKSIQSQVFQEAKQQVSQAMRQRDHLISIVYSEEWHEGVIGIVASKLVEHFKVPAIVFTNAQQENTLKASARSAGSLSIFNCLKECSDLYTKFGGHKAAAGLSLPRENLNEFTQRMNHILKEIPAIERTVQESFDLEIKPQDITPQLVRHLESLEPFGMGNPKPLFKMKNFKITSFDILKDLHIRWSLTSKEKPSKSFRGISFNYIGKFGVISPDELFLAQQRNGEELTAYFTLGINRFNGNEYVQLQIEKITLGDF